jgi:quercetin dioxygenase-like cupin family protein
MPPIPNIECDDLDDAIQQHRSTGYRLDMIKPADAPREALMSLGDHVVLLVQKPARQTVQTSTTDWVQGRAGMEYRDLIPDRLAGKVIASHIRLAKGGAVDDYVHYHKVEFQMIHCIKGRIRVVYEDQGEPFWLEPGDWVIQPPEIRHRVLECDARSEVIELSMPAVHETWVDHDITLPTVDYRPDREFSGQRFVRCIAPKA